MRRARVPASLPASAAHVTEMQILNNRLSPNPMEPRATLGIYDEAAGLFHFVYTIERGVRYPDEPLELIGFRRRVMETRAPMLINEDVVAAKAFEINAALSRQFARVVLPQKLSLAAPAKRDDFVRHGLRHAQPGIASLGAPSLNDRPHASSAGIRAGY